MASKQPCRYFLRGNCKFGDRCYYPHPKGGQQPQQQYGSPTFSQNRYNVFTKVNNQNQQNTSTTSTTTANNDIMKAITTEMDVWNKSKMWPFSCFAHTKESPCLPGFADFSPEELRVEAYAESPNHAARVNYKTKETQLGLEYKLKREKLLNPDATTKQNLIKFIDEAKKVTNSTPSTKGQLFSTNSVFGGSSPSSVFGGSKSGSGFGAKTNAFGGTSQNLFGKGPSSSSNANSMEDSQTPAFGASSTQNSLFKPATFGATSAFGASKPSAFGGSTSAFGGGSAQTSGFGGSSGKSSAFGGSAQTSAFGSSMQTKPSGFGTSTFGSAAQPSAFGAKPTQTSAFGGSAFGGAQQTSGFGATPAAGPVFGGSGTFGKPAGQVSPFGATTTSAFGAQSTSAFGSSASNPASAFGASATNTASAFGAGNMTSAANTTSAFGATSQTSAFGGATSQTSAFGSSAQTSATSAQSSGLFGKPANTGLFGKPVQATDGATGGATGTGEDIYTVLDQLTLQEKQEFEAQKFTLGRIPTRPPPREYVR